MRVRYLLYFQILFWGQLKAQITEIGLSYGKLYAQYKFIDMGNGFRNVPKSQYNGVPTLSVVKRFSKNFSTEAKVSFVAYPQYTGTRLYNPGFASEFYTGNITLLVNYSIYQNARFEGQLNGGIGIGIMPDRYLGEFTELFNNGIGIDSISRGVINRDYTSAFPTICSGGELSYRVGNRLKLTTGITFQLGIIKVTEYQIFYNDGSGKNDQFARQWGNGSFYSYYLGIKYKIIRKNAKTD